MGVKQRTAALAHLPQPDADERLLVVATGPFVGEGFDCPALDTMFLAAPIASKGRLVQYVGRILRAYPGKTTAEVHDHHDVREGVLAFRSSSARPRTSASACPTLVVGRFGSRSVVRPGTGLVSGRQAPPRTPTSSLTAPAPACPPWSSAVPAGQERAALSRRSSIRTATTTAKWCVPWPSTSPSSGRRYGGDCTAPRALGQRGRVLTRGRPAPRRPARGRRRRVAPGHADRRRRNC